ncbi:hypothetical protein DPMN_141892 [Dreissena polymorpha]|uniref:Uncharacterized protein n=1 Tax=Dreissena polymorpha TaxID=45954 RepID=A0A9D4GED9_DREPO|nr:hypothetical protein DPMN_141892 [Dreissena polymorpha]
MIIFNVTSSFPRRRRTNLKLEVARQRPTCIPTPHRCYIKGNFGWARPMLAGRPRVGTGAMHMNRCRNEHVILKGNFGYGLCRRDPEGAPGLVMGPCIVEMYRIVIRDVE